MTDRRVHAVLRTGEEIVRYDRAGKWYVEYHRVRKPLTVHEAAARACERGAQRFLGLPGGARFDRLVAQDP